MASMVQYIETHPFIAFIVGGLHIATARLIEHAEMPTIVMQLFQIGAWTVTITVGLVSLYGTWRNRKK